MTLRRRQTLLFLLCAAVLTAAGYAWGYANTYARFYSPGSLLDRETLDLQFNTQLLHYADSHQPEKVRSRVYRRLAGEVHYLDQVIDGCGDPSVTRSAAESLERARAALRPSPESGGLTVHADSNVRQPQVVANQAASQAPPPVAP